MGTDKSNGSNFGVLSSPLCPLHHRAAPCWSPPNLRLYRKAAQVSGKLWFSKPIYQRFVESRPLARNIKRAAWLQRLPDGMDANL
jgi:hypothetical protein